MAEKQVTIRISATDNFSQVFQKYQQQIGQAAQDTQQFNTATAGSSGGVDSLVSSVGDAIKGFIAFKAVGMVAELVALGGAANATEATFTALSGGVNEATTNLNAMRAATGGVVADTELMAGANRLLAMNIATTGQQAADLAGVAVNLGKAFGQDASTAIENFSLMIANQSLLRLDSLGISAAAVRERMKELANEFPNMDKQARFTQATLEQATKTVDRLGTSITAAQTPIAKLSTSFENFKTNVGQSLATTLNNAITTTEQLGTIIAYTYDQIANGGRQSAIVAEIISNVNARAAMQSMEDWRAVAMQPGLSAAYNTKEAARNAALNSSMLQHYGGGGDGAALNPYAGMQSFFGGASDRYAAGAGMRDYASDKMYQFESNTSGIGKFLDPMALDDINARFKELQQLNEQGLISDDNLAKAEAFKNHAEEAAEAFKNMSLTDIFGQSSGGMKGEIGDMVIAQMKANGASDEDIAAARQKFDLGSGRQTSASAAMQNTVAPMIANLAPEQQQQAIENINAFLEMAAKMNLTPDQIAAGLPGATGFKGTGTGQSFDIKPGQTPGEIAAALGISVEQLLAVVGAPNAHSVQPGSYTMGTGYAPVPGFNPQGYAGGFGVPQGPLPGYQVAGGQNPLVGSGFVQESAWNVHGENAGGANPADEMKDMETSSGNLADNIKAMADQMAEADTKATTFNDTLDLAAKSREMVFTVNLKDNTKGFLELLLNERQMGTLNLSTGGSGSTRDRGGSPSNAGFSPTSNQRPYTPS